MDREHWRALAARHSRCDDEPRRCRECAAYWPCYYRLRADRELAAGDRAPPAPAGMSAIPSTT